MNKRLVKFIFAWPMKHVSADLKLISYETDFKILEMTFFACSIESFRDIYLHCWPFGAHNVQTKW